ncbi:hypothetical protein FRC12_002436 [Ceratobasidium sp. 428]|nr:hypothetical protein FRC09_000311 [Ceratobasidium sp. 395]KAG8773618.1 hypothetical protein FRC12_002436 [Ceratobasidium sp. 428]
MTSTTVLLCLACSQSLSLKVTESYFRTPCCGRLICDQCLSKNARLRRYNPCLSCLGGVGLVQSSSEDRRDSSYQKQIVQNGRDNEAETFVLGDDEDEDEGEELPAQGVSRPQHEDVHPPATSAAPGQAQPTASPVPSNHSLPASSTYYIKPRDTVTGIALRYGVDPRQLCRLNKLPTSTLTTTPHLLHTRTTLQLPPGSRAPSPPPPDLQDRIEARARERAARAFQAVTKETDWGVAQTYVALLDVDDDSNMKEGKRRMVDPRSKDGRQAMAVDSYLDDNAWEEEQRKAGLSPRIEGFPYFNFKGKENVEPRREGSSSGGSDWWQKLWSGSSK